MKKLMGLAVLATALAACGQQTWSRVDGRQVVQGDFAAQSAQCQARGHQVAAANIPQQAPVINNTVVLGNQPPPPLNGGIMGGAVRASSAPGPDYALMAATYKGCMAERGYIQVARS